MSESGKKQGKQERRFSQEQYEMLLRCSQKKDMTEWNEWRAKRRAGNPFEEIWLQGAELQNANLQEADLRSANLQGANLWGAKLQGAKLQCADLQGAILYNAKLQGAELQGADLKEANLEIANLQGAELRNAKLQGAKFMGAIVNGSTCFLNCEIDEDTDFRETALENTRIEAGTKTLLKYNIRRKNWEDWYKEHWFWEWPFRLFWFFSDYGASGKRVVGVFFLLALLFAAVYMNWAYWAPPGIVSNLVVQPEMGEAAWHYFLRAPVRAVYFSIVTMTTLGFGDMYANKGSIAGHVILAVQVILGYVLLGALITRFAVLFTAGGPAGKFAESGKGHD